MLSALTSLFSRWRHPGTDALSEYLDGMLSPRRQAQVARHLESCDGCQAELASLQLTVGLLHRIPQVEPPRSFIFTAPPFTAPPLVERPRRPQGALNWALAGAGASLALLLAVVLLADMVGVLRGDDGENAQQEASPGSDAAIATTQATADMLADPSPQAVMAPAGAPPPASAPTPPAPAVERYTRPPVEPIEEGEPPDGAAVEDISALISQSAAAAIPEEASTSAEPVDVERLTQEILDRIERDGSATLEEVKAAIREAVRNAAEAAAEEDIGTGLLMVAGTPAATPTPAPAPMEAETSTSEVVVARNASASEDSETTGTSAAAVAPSPPPATATLPPPATPASTGTPAPTPVPAPTTAPTPRSTPTSAEAPAPLPTLAPMPTPTKPPPAPTPTATLTPTAAPTASVKPVPSRSAQASSPEDTAQMSEEKTEVAAQEQQASTPEPALPQLIVDDLGDTGEGATNVWWRVLEGLLAACAVLALGLFFRRWRRGRAA